VILATWSRMPLLHARDVRSGQHLTTLGADEPGKVELSGDLLRNARVVVDDVRLATSTGALGGARLDAAGTLGDVLRGDVPARDAQDRPSVYAPVGLPWQDLALTWLVYRRATTADVTVIDLLG
jgi:ornithine cyclodeaminase/alanine dehydrogenase-like protein (mu-crystallin family)